MISMIDENKKEKDPFHYFKLFSSWQEIRKKFKDKSLNEEERKKIWEEGLPIWTEMNKTIDESKPVTLKKFKKLMKSINIPESDKPYWDKLLSIVKHSKTSSDIFLKRSKKKNKKEKKNY